MYKIFSDANVIKDLDGVKRLFKTNIIDMIGFNDVIPYSKRIINNKRFIDNPQIVYEFKQLNPLYINIKKYNITDENNHRNPYDRNLTIFIKKLSNYEAHNILEEIDFKTDPSESLIYLSSQTLFSLLGIEQKKNSFFINCIHYIEKYNELKVAFISEKLFNPFTPWFLEFYFRK